MDLKSSRKVLSAGFRIIRCEDYPTPRIKERAGQNAAWVTLEEDFPSKAARDRRFKELLKDPKIIYD